LDYLAIGHLTIDRLVSGNAVGGSAAYSSATAARLGMAAVVLTVAGDEADWRSALPGVDILRVRSPASTSFENRYRRGRRTQRLAALAHDITPDMVPAKWRQCPIVHLAPVAHEVDARFPALFPGSLVGLTPQGLLRDWGSDGQVTRGHWAGDDALLAGCQVVIFSEEDIEGAGDFLDSCLKVVPVTVLTRGAHGATLFLGTQSFEFPAYPAREVDPTGAGDVFASAFLIEYHLARDPLAAAAFACCAASFAVERQGLEGIPDRQSVERRLALYRGGSGR
jgi:1D-myo-inositol 3-kinase